MKSMIFKKPKDGSCISKFADISKTPKERLQAFLQAKDGHSKDGCGEDQFRGTSFLRDHCGDIIFLIYEAFYQYLDQVQLKKRKKSSIEEADLLEIILPALERVLQFLPDKINVLWHYNGIAGILRELLTPANNLAPNHAIELKLKGIRLTILWILGLLDLEHEQSSTAVEVFNHILPELKNPEQDSPDNETIVLRFQFLLDNLTCNIRHIHWPDVTENELRKRRIKGFKTVFNLCKKSYFKEILRSHEKRRSKHTKEAVNQNKKHRSDCPLIIEKEVDNHFNKLKTMNELSNEQLDCLFQLHDRIMKWFVKHGKSILPHDKTNCHFVSKVDDLYNEVDNFEEEVELCRIVDRVIFTERDNIKLMNDAFEHGPLVFQRRMESNFTEHMLLEEHPEFSFIKMITLYSELIYNIKDCNVLGHKHDDKYCPEFLTDSRTSSKKWRQKDLQVERKVKNFLKAATLNVAPLLRYPYSYLTFSGPTKKMIELAAQTAMGYYNVIVQQIEQADANACYRIILCMIKGIEHNFQHNFPIHSYDKQLHNLLHVVRFVGRKVSLPLNTWNHLRDLLFMLEKTDETAPAANEFWHEVMKALTQEIFVQVYGVEWKGIREKDEKAPKTKGKLSCTIEEKSHLNTKLNAALSRLQLPRLQRQFRSEKPTIQKLAPNEERSQPTEYHYHGLNEIFIKSVSLKNWHYQHCEDHNDNNDELRPNNGEHPIILWRRFLTLKGNPNKYAKNAVLHKRMFESLCDILDMLLWLDDHKDKQDRKHADSNYRHNVPDHSVFTYVYHILPWFFEAFLVNPSEEFLLGKKVAMRMLCKCIVRFNPIKPPVPLLHLFYNVLLNCLKKEGVRAIENRCYQNARLDLMFEVVKGTKHLFSINLSGCHVHDLMKCLSDGAIRVLDQSLASGPKADAIVLLGSMYTYPWVDKSLKQQIAIAMKEFAKSESDQFNRSRAIQMLGYMIITMLSKRSVTTSNASPKPPPPIIERMKTSTPSDMPSARSNSKPTDTTDLVELVNIVMLQARSANSRVALSALSVIRDLSDNFDELLQVESTLPKQIMEILLFSLNQYMDTKRIPAEESDDDRSTSTGTSSRVPLYDPLLSSHGKNFNTPTPPVSPIKSNALKYHQEAVIIGTIMAVVEWVLQLGVSEHVKILHLTTRNLFQPPNLLNAQYTSLLKNVFKVLQLVALEKPFSDQLRAYCSTNVLDRLREYRICDIKEGEFNPETIDMSYPSLPGSEEPHSHENIKCCATAALLVLCQWHQQFPLCGGPDYSSSMVYEYNSDDKNGKTRNFNKKQDLQILVMDESSTISLVELGKLPLNMEQCPDCFESQPGYSRVIFRNIAGRFSWLSKKLWALKEPPDSPLPPSDLIDYTSHLVIKEEDCPTLTPSHTLRRSDSASFSLYSCSDREKDRLYQTTDYVKATSPELAFYRELKKKNKNGQEGLFNKVGSMLRNQKINEENADNPSPFGTPVNQTLESTFSGSWSSLLEASSPFQHCRGLVSALGLLSWDKRFENHGRQVELLDPWPSNTVEKDKDVCESLSELDKVYNREVHKFGLIYIACGDEKREDVLSHNVGSKAFEEFVAGLGWEVNWRDLHGYVPTIGTDVMKSTTVHYANATSEIVFHVGTRLEPGNQDPALYRFKYIGNDYIGLIWSEHNRDVKIDTFKTAYLNYVIVIYPMRDLKKCRVQIIVNFLHKEEKCKSIENGIGPLFDGALVDRDILPELVRKTMINAERAINIYQERPGLYRDRARNIRKLQNYKRETTFEEVACELMSPSLVDFGEYSDYTRSTVAGVKQPPQRSGSVRTSKKSAARQSTGPSSQDMSESERTEKKKKRSKRERHELSDSDTVSTGNRK